MRPVRKSNAPPAVFTKYGQAKPHLCGQLDNYCSYCESPLSIAPLEVEHILYKEHYTTFVLDWANFLLSCKNCNSTKGTKDLRTIAVFLPHLHNPLCYLDIYHSVVILKPSLPAHSPDALKAQAFIDLCGLDRHDTSPLDDRWERRMKTFDLAARERDYYADSPNSRHLELIIHLAKGYGFFSVWYIVFVDFPEVRLALIQAFVGTDAACFDAANKYEPLPRSLPDGGLALAT